MGSPAMVIKRMGRDPASSLKRSLAGKSPWGYHPATPSAEYRQ